MLEFLEKQTALVIVLKITITLALTILAARLFRRLLSRLEKRLESKKRRSVSRISSKLIINLLVCIVYVIGLLAAIGQIPALSAALRTVLAGSGVLAIVVGFAAQESFGNLVSGIFLTLFKPFDVGNRVHLVSEDISGYIEDITLRHTVIRTPTDTRLIIPNSVMGSAIVENTNYHADEPTKHFITVDVSYDSDLELAMDLMAKAITAHPLYAGEQPLRIYVCDFGASGISLRGTMTTKTVDENFRACSEARVRIKKDFDANGIVIPFQTVTISNHSAADAIRIVSDKSNN